MLVWIDENKKITAYNNIISEEKAQQYISTNCLWADDLKINSPQVSENQAVEMYLNDDLTIRYDIVAIGVEVSEQEQLQAEMLLNQCNILIAQENQDAVLAEILINQLGV